MNAIEQKIYDELLEELSLYADLGAPPARRLAGALASFGEAMEKLKKYRTEHPFINVAEEVAFFKQTKPAFVAEQLYAMEMFTIASNRPLNDAATLRAFYQQELHFVRRFFGQQQFLYAYYQGDMKELDERLFVRGAKPVDIPVPDLVDLDPSFSTCGDKLFAKFMAYERLQSYLMGCLTEEPAAPVATAQRLTKWPGDKTDLIELGYAVYTWLWARKSKVPLVQVISWLESNFGVTLQKHSQRFAEIKLRKVSSRTKFLDELRDALTGYMDDGDAWEPGKIS